MQKKSPTVRSVGAALGGALIAATLSPFAAAPAMAAPDLPEPIAQFDFDADPTDGAFVSEGAVATVQGTPERVPGQDGDGSAVELGESFWLDVTAPDGAPLLTGLDELTISYDSLPGSGADNTGWTVFAAASAAAPEGGEEHYLGLMDRSSSLTVERYANTGGRDEAGNLSASGLTGEWKHVDLVIDGAEARLYIDQELVDANVSGPTLAEMLGDESILQVGRANWGGGEYFAGLLDNLTIYSQALTSEQLGLPAVESVTVDGADLDGDAVEIWQGESTTLTAAVVPSGADHRVDWSSSDTSVVTVDGGVLQGIAPGTATVAAASADAPSVRTEIDVDVIEMTESSAAERDLDALSIENADNMRGSFSVATEGRFGSTVAWEITAGSDHATFAGGVNDDSTAVRVMRPAAGADAVTVELEATVTNGETTLVRTFSVQVQPMPADDAEAEAYVWAFFTGEGTGGERISLAASKGNDALDWNTLNEGEPLFTSEHGEEGLRDPFILRSPDGDKFYMIATDLKHDGRPGGFGGAQVDGSLHVEIWESDDLVTWSDQRHVQVSSEYAGNTWAPEAHWDAERELYVLYWASNLYDTTDPADRSGPNYNRMMYATTHDFVTFSEPQVWIDVDRRGQAGAGSIDVTVVPHDGEYYRVYKDENTMTLRQERSTDLLATIEGSYPEVDSERGALDEWDAMGEQLGAGQPNGYGGTFRQGEGPTLFPANDGDVNGYEHYLFIDQPGYHGGPNHYVPLATHDLTDASEWAVIGDEMPQSQFPANADGGMPRHGTILPVTRTQYQQVLEAHAPAIAVQSVEAIEVDTELDQAPVLPETARLAKLNGDTEDAAVVWDEIPAAAYASAGTFTVRGVAQDDSRQPVEAVVTVIAADDTGSGDGSDDTGSGDGSGDAGTGDSGSGDSGAGDAGAGDAGADGGDSTGADGTGTAADGGELPATGLTSQAAALAIALMLIVAGGFALLARRLAVRAGLRRGAQEAAEQH